MGNNAEIRKSTLVTNMSTTTSSQNITYSKPNQKKKPDGVKQGFFSLLLNQTMIPIFLMLICPNVVMILWHTARFGMWKTFDFAYIIKIWSEVQIGNSTSVAIILGYMFFSLVLMVCVPGKKFLGPETDKGNVPVYKDNGFSCFVISMAALVAVEVYLKSQHRDLSVTFVYDHFGDLLATMNVCTHLLCAFLCLKGYIMPSSSDSGTTGNPLFDYYWGTELYPRVCGVDIKVFTNCRFGMTVWGLLVAIFALKNYQLYGFIDSVWVTCILQLVYIAKFFWWESGYMRTIDIMLDRAGFYICWGCLVFVPGLYASPSLYSVRLQQRLGPGGSLCLLVVGIVAIVVNYLADRQKIDVRASDGRCAVWGGPARVIRARLPQYTRGRVTGERESLLLVNGYWGISRHFHYVPELILAASWSLPQILAFDVFPLPFAYLAFLFGLLMHRTFRDDEKCSAKYGAYWIEYKAMVPYRVLPYVF